MADKLQGTWVFNKYEGERYNGQNGAAQTHTFNVRFISNGKEFAGIQIASSAFAGTTHTTPLTWAIIYLYPEGVTNANGESIEMYYRNISGGITKNDEYESIEILSSYDEVENAYTLLDHLSQRATFTPNESGSNTGGGSNTGSGGTVRKIRGNMVSTNMKRPDFLQPDPKKSDYILNNPLPRLEPQDEGKVLRVKSGKLVAESALNDDDKADIVTKVIAALPTYTGESEVLE